MGHSVSSKVRWFESLLKTADITLNGDGPGDIRVLNSRFYDRVLSTWSLGLGESYMDGDWECDALDVFCTKALSGSLDQAIRGLARVRLVFEILRAKCMNLQTQRRSFQVGEVHYDVGNDLYTKMLDPHMMYSCGYWERAQTLAAAQEDKLKLIAEKLELKPGETLLDIGCGWGGLLAYAAKHYGVRGLGVTISREQKKLAEERCAGLPIEIRLIDYRDLQGDFDKIVSVGMFEHVGLKNYPVYFETAARLLKPQGLFLLHTIGTANTIACTDPWIDRYIFPNGKIPATHEIGRAIEGHFILEDWHNFGTDYDKTLMAWHAQFESAWPGLSERYGERFYRMWRYYLLMSAGNFRSRQGQLWQLVLSRRDRRIPYRSVRFRGLA